MPIRVEYTKDGIGVEVCHNGITTGEELIEAISSIVYDEKFSSLRYWVADRTKCSKYIITPDHMEKFKELCDFTSKTNQNIKMVFVSPENLEFGHSEMVKAFSCMKKMNIYICSDRSSAMKWVAKELAKA